MKKMSRFFFGQRFILYIDHRPESCVDWWQISFSSNRKDFLEEELLNQIIEYTEPEAFLEYQSHTKILRKWNKFVILIHAKALHSSHSGRSVPKGWRNEHGSWEFIDGIRRSDMVELSVKEFALQAAEAGQW